MSKSRLAVIAILCVGLCAILVSMVSVTAVTGSDTIRVTPSGEWNITLEYGENFEDPGAEAVLLHEGREGKPLEVEIQGAVDTSRVGMYVLRYIATHKGTVGTAYRYVQVVDTQPPELTLQGDLQITLPPGQTYEEQGYTAQDQYDGDLTQQVLRQTETGKLVYSVSDSSGNRATAERQVIYHDPVPPVLTLLGDPDLIVPQGNAYREPGYQAVDDCDGDITDKVTVSGNVDVHKPGRYVLTYTATDNFGNTATQKRAVFVWGTDLPLVNDPSSDGKAIYLTFDDGPGPYTPALLDVLERYNVQATFFVVNTSHISTIKRAAEEGHTIAIHTATHKFDDIYASEEAYFADLYKMQDIIKEHTGQEAKLLRFPGGSSNTISASNKGIMTRLAAAVEEKGFVYFDWSVDSKDAGGAKTSEEVFNNVVKGVEKREYPVVLMHDIKDYTVEAVEALIMWGLSNGYKFLPLTSDSPTCHHRINN